MTIYEFVVGFVGEVPEQFQFIYSILTLIITTSLVGAFSSLFYFFMRIFKVVR